MTKAPLHHPVVRLWASAYGLSSLVSVYFGLQPSTILATLLSCFLPPFIMHLRSCSSLMELTRTRFPDEWKRVGSAFRIRDYLYDASDFGDESIAMAKKNLKWWQSACLLGLLGFIPTLFLISTLSDKVRQSPH